MSVFNDYRGPSLPQPLGPNDTPTFFDVRLSSLGAGYVTSNSTGLLSSSPVPVIPGVSTGAVVSNSSGVLSSVAIPTGSILGGTGSIPVSTTLSGDLGMSVVASVGDLKITPPQDLRTTASPSFNGLTLPFTQGLLSSTSIGVVSSTPTPIGAVAVGGASGVPTAIVPSSTNGVTISSGLVINTPQDIRTSASPSFVRETLTSATPLTLSSFTTAGILANNASGVVSSTLTPAITSVTFSGGTALSSYRENTFVPSLLFGGAAVGMTYTTRTGAYTRIGNTVFFNIIMALSAKGSSTGSATISGLPYNCTTANIGYNVTYSNCTIADGKANNYGGISTLTTVGTTMGLYMDDPRASVLTASPLTNTQVAATSAFYLVGFYPTTDPP